MRESRFYLVGGALAFVGFGAMMLFGPGWLAVLLVLGGLATAVAGAVLRAQRQRRVRVEIEDEQVHPIPVLDAPKGTFDLIAGMAVKVDNRRDDPIGVRIETLLYERTAWKWDRPLSDGAAKELLATSVVPARSVKSFFVRNTTRIPATVDVLTPSHFVKLLIDTSDYGKSIHRVFLNERFELQKEPPRPVATAASDREPLLPFSERLEYEAPAGRRRSTTERFGELVRRLRPRASPAPRGEVKIHRLRRTEDSLEGLIDEIEAELDDELSRG